MLIQAASSVHAFLQRRNCEEGALLPPLSELGAELALPDKDVREAMYFLDRIGMVEDRLGIGRYLVALPSWQETKQRIKRAIFQDQLEMRIILESEAASLAAHRRNEEDLQEMHQALQAGKNAANNIGDCTRQILRFHSSLVAAAHNIALSSLYSHCAPVVEETIKEIARHVPPYKTNMSDQEVLLGTIKMGDGEAAAEMIHRMLTPALRISLVSGKILPD
ncbi:GntR family transcriptional regulator [Alcanivorax sp. 521-1]|uniref:GntR family transcriptional regulator n=1 Tax=Alloalcanivorax profundimaris TaxID=2735259 RepID=A0ABS0AS63_9GAMM|nr:FCD domain-containing protein [Alloalcanivorax profundimaris]MBF5056452.1 GntR family transcriptional regulator [Alloalcanivorax profundimaris]MBM1143782.1 FadR family transcriptional regulator [Alcanivorax sp. ZXX171]